MKVIFTQYGITIMHCHHMTILPHIGEKIEINADMYEVKNIIWHFENSMYVEIQFA